MPKMCIWVKDKAVYYWKEIEILKPSMLCFELEKVESFSSYQDLYRLFGNLKEFSEDLEIPYYKDVREFGRAIEKLLRLTKYINKHYAQSIMDLKHYLTRNNLEVDEKYFFPA